MKNSIFKYKWTVCAEFSTVLLTDDPDFPDNLIYRSRDPKRDDYCYMTSHSTFGLWMKLGYNYYTQVEKPCPVDIYKILKDIEEIKEGVEVSNE